MPRLIVILLALVVVCAAPGQAHAWMTQPKAERYVRENVRSDFGALGVLASDARARCRFLGTGVGGYRVFQCRFGVRYRAFRYRGSAQVYPFRVEGKPEPLYTLAYRWYRGACGALRLGTPHAISTLNLKCPRARRWIFDWYARGQFMPSAYECELRSLPATARCVSFAGRHRRAFSFKYPE